MRYVAWDRDGRATLHAYDAADLESLRADLARPPRPLPPPRLVGALTGAWDAAGHRQRVGRIRDLIAAGDLYQANLTLPFRGALVAQPDADAALFLDLIGRSPATCAALLRGGGDSVVSHSPERFLRLGAGILESAPIKGTRRRIAGREDAVRAELLACAKERAELAMIVDLVRNDLGRVCRPGSVRVTSPAEILDLPYVHHLRARVRGACITSAAEAISAAFPAGSITGCPKIRAMQVIAELEAGERGPYCGAFGWLGNAACDLAVAIRTIVVGRDGVRVHAGGGITADSDPDAEWDEARAKATAMAAALGAAV
jgi:anthranilate/para-aminobenzoate synthase component I